MSASRRSLCLLCAGFFGLSSGCSGGGESPGGTGGSGAGAACDALNGELVITDDTNYSLPSSLSIERRTLKDATDLTFEWGGLTRDFYGKSLNAAQDIDMVLLSLWAMTPEELESRLERDDLPRSENIGAITAYPEGGVTSANLLSFNLQGNPIPEEELWGFFDTSAPNFEYPPDRYTFLAMAATGTALGKGARMLSFFTLDPGSPDTTLSFSDASTELDFTANLAGARALRVPRGVPGITVDWSEMTLTALGNEFLPMQVTEAAVAHFPTSSLEDLERDFVYLEERADGWWRAKVEIGASIDLSTLKDETEATFPGIDERGTWLVALFCTSHCSNPAPWSISILKPCD
jgi:hypothetical protein